MHNIEGVLICPDSTVQQVMTLIDTNAIGIALVVDSDRRLLGTITDGDVRRAILRGLGLDARAALVMNASPVSARESSSPAERLRLMDEGKKGNAVQHLPLLDPDGRVTGIALRRELMRAKAIAVTAAIMAGGNATGTKL